MSAQAPQWRRFLMTLRVMLYKNWLLKSRRPLSTVFEILVPVLVMLAMVGIHNLVPKSSYPEYIYADTGTNPNSRQHYFNFAQDGVELFNNVISGQKVAFTPDHLFTRALVQEMINYNITNASSFTFFASDQDLETYLLNPRYQMNDNFPAIYLAVSFYSFEPGWDYSIRMNATDFRANVPPTNLPFTDPFARGVDGNWQLYAQKGFLWFQMLIDSFILSTATGLPMDICAPPNCSVSTPLPAEGFAVSFLPFPTGPYTTDTFSQIAGGVVGLFFTIGYLWPTSRLIRDLVLEKEKKIKEGMKMMGLTDAVFWLSWIITYVLIYLISTTIITLETSGSVYKHSSGNVIFLYFFVFSLSCFSLAVLISTFFDKSKSAATFGAIIFLALFFPFYGVANQQPSASYSSRTGICLFAPACFGLGAQALAALESAGVGANYGNWYSRIDNFSPAACVGMMWLDTLLYFLLAWYIEKVFPGAYGTPLPPYFLFTSAYWFPRQSSSGNKVTSSQKDIQMKDMAGNGKYIPQEDTSTRILDETVKSMLVEEKQAAQDRHFEHVPKEVTCRPSVKILDIQKSYNVNGQVVKAVQGLDFEIYEGQITALLGHNGAGKSTLISMLTGLIPPTSGDAEVYGYKLTTEMARIRESLGVCPQHDVLFDDLTVYEHLELFARLKGSVGDLSEMIKEIIAEVGLTEKVHATSSTLSGGQKRKLSIGIALIGNSKVIFLDECTSGMDVYSRRWIWNMLLKKKEGRIIILTTHFMNEADQLGDRIAIMSKGLLKCCGSSLFLKNLYGVGYTMTISKSEEADPKQIVKTVKSHVETAEQLTSVGGELQFRLPFAVSNKFPELFKELDQQIASQEEKEATIKSYGIAVTTLEEVFLRVGKEEEHDVDALKTPKPRISYLHQNGTTTALPHANGTDSQRPTESKISSAGTKFAEMDKEHFERDGLYVGFRHFVALFIKRWHNAKRDRRQWIFQVILPMVLTLNGLAAIHWGSTSSNGHRMLILSPQEYNQPDPYIFNNQSGLSFYPPDIFKTLSTGDYVHPETTHFSYRGSPDGTVRNDVNMSYYLLDTIVDYKLERYGAIQLSDQYYNPLAPQPVQSQLGTASIYFNSTGTHSLPLSLNSWHLAVLRWRTGDNSQKITLRSYPFPLTLSEKALDGLSYAVILGIGFAFIPSSWVAFAVKEREINAKHQQLISGVSTLAYWASNLLWDFFNYLLPLFLALMLIAAFNVKPLLGDAAGATFISMLLFGPSIASFTYMWSFLFKSHSTAQNVMIVVYVFTGVLLAFVSFILDAIKDTQHANKKLKFFYRLLPNFCFGESMINLITREATIGGAGKGPFDMDVIGWPCTYMTLEAFIYFGVVLLIEHILATPALLSYFIQGPQVQDPPYTDDEDVAAEKVRLQADDSTNKDVVKVRGLRKEFQFWRRPAKVAVKDMWFGIHEGECFGFLGINGAGKTTTLQMLTGAEYPTSGSATLKGYDIMHEQLSLRRHMGYCPQFDALLETLTGRETLCLYARIKGVPESKVPSYVNAMIQRIGLKDYADRPCGGYSGGNKRKLSVGVALIGNPTVIFLDEPSTGMDPGAKRFMWELIAATNAGRSLILTTHSLEEAEALCHRIGIMVSGRLRCLGSAQHLRHRYGQGYQIELKTEDKKECVEALRKWVEATFEGAHLVEIHGDRLKYKINRSMTLGNVFGEIEKAKQELNIQEYSCAEYSLEQIFIHFAKQQEEEKAQVEGVLEENGPEFVRLNSSSP